MSNLSFNMKKKRFILLAFRKSCVLCSNLTHENNPFPCLTHYKKKLFLTSIPSVSAYLLSLVNLPISCPTCSEKNSCPTSTPPFCACLLKISNLMLYLFSQKSPHSLPDMSHRHHLVVAYCRVFLPKIEINTTTQTQSARKIKEHRKMFTQFGPNDLIWGVQGQHNPLVQFYPQRK